MEMERGCRNAVTRPLNQVYLTRQWNVSTQSSDTSMFNGNQNIQFQSTIKTRNFLQQLPTLIGAVESGQVKLEVNVDDDHHSP